MVYLSVDDITPRIHYDETDFSGTSADFDNLLQRLEKESRGLIESYMGDITFSAETDKTVTILPKDSTAVPLEYPINNICSVEYKRKISSDWKTLDTDRYTNTDHRLVLRRYPEMFYQRKGCERMNKLNIDLNRLSWSDFCEEIKIVYDRGFSSIPENVKSIQLDMINRLLRKLKMEQNISTMNPEDVQAITQANVVMTEDIKSSLDQITSMKNFVRSV